MRASSIGIVKDDAYRVTLSGPQAADAMPKINSVDTPGSPYRAVMHGKGHRISLAQWHNFRPGLHPRTLLGQNELAAREVPLRLGEKKGYLGRKDMLAVKVLMQAVVVHDSILQQQRCWLRLTEKYPFA